MHNLRLNDIYPCIQGEGVQTGVPMVMVRLHGCAVGCVWCDTKETWQANPADCVSSIEATRGTNAKYVITGPVEIARYIREHCPGPRWVLISGGEPAEQDLAELVAELHRHGYQVAVETSGTAPGVIGAGFDWVCMSPKIGMPGGREIIGEVVALADEIKHVIAKPADLDKLDQLLATHPPKPGATICLQPVSQAPAATMFCIEAVQARGWRLSVQVHKYLRIP